MKTVTKRLAHMFGAVMLALTLGMSATAVEAVVAPQVAQAKTVTVAKKAAKKTLIGKKKATSIALKRAKLKKSQVKKLETKLEWEGGRRIYEVEFKRGKYEYEVEINAYTGKVLDYERELD